MKRQEITWCCQCGEALTNCKCITCPECTELVSLDNMLSTEDKLCCHNKVCKGCYENLEDDY